MNDKAFQWSLTAVTILMLIWIVAGIGVLFLSVFLVLLSAIVVEMGVAIVLLYYWGKDYMGRRI